MMKETQRVAKKILSEEKATLMMEFNSHPVTLEIEGGAYSANISNTLNGYGNLFTFIGFYENTDPVDKVRLMLQHIIKLKKISKGRGNRPIIKVQYRVADIRDFKTTTPLPWESGRSWVIGIETGISGFGSYMYDNTYKGSRSDMGFQAKLGSERSVPMRIRAGRFRNIKYMSDMLRKFYKRIHRRTKK